AKAVLTDIGTEELAHWEIIATLIFKIVDRATPEELIEAGMGPNYIQHGRDVYPNDAAGVPWTAAYIQAIEDPITNLHEDLAAEQKARTTYEHLINSTKDRGVIETLSFLREREVVHFQRFGETLRLVQEHMDNIKHKR
ncbi:MAG TPA: manganese catalase family protein, partial [Sedimentibacter sp.]|nr:manganese catalase family protein [Sedimentibacter sp.]